MELIVTHAVVRPVTQDPTVSIASIPVIQCPVSMVRHVLMLMALSTATALLVSLGLDVR